MATSYFKLIKKYPRFVYQDFSWFFESNNLRMSFSFEIPPAHKFSSRFKIKNIPQKRFKEIEKETLDNLVFHLGLIEMLSYWKLSCSPIIEIKAGRLEKKQLNFWRKLIFKGMGQFFFENKIDFRKPGFLKIVANKNKKGFLVSSLPLNPQKILVPLGGGKDSPVAIEILKKTDFLLGSFVLNPKPVQQKIIKIAGIKENIIVERKIDPRLLELNKIGYLNGHIPFSALLALLSLLLALLFDFKYAAFAWERSSEEGNLRYKNYWINHQWSKTFKFEKMFFDYSREYLLKDVYVFSFLRPLWEIQISKIFANLPQYHLDFLSCNQPYKMNSKIKTWCKKCPKCLFVFSSLYPFLGEKAIEIFEKNLFEKKSLLRLMLQILGREGSKPFECLGTKKESQVALYLSLKRYQKDFSSKKLPFLLKYFEKEILPKLLNIKILSKMTLKSFAKKHNLPPSLSLKKLLKNHLQK